MRTKETWQIVVSVVIEGTFQLASKLKPKVHWGKKLPYGIVLICIIIAKWDVNCDDIV